MITGVNHITLCVHDLSVSIGFYRDTLGATLRAEGPRSAYLDLGALWLCLEQSDAVSPRSDDSHIALSCSVADFPVLSARIRAQTNLWKQNKSPGPSLYFYDPDHHKLELHAGTLQDRLAHYRAHPDKGMRPLP